MPSMNEQKGMVLNYNGKLLVRLISLPVVKSVLLKKKKKEISLISDFDFSYNICTNICLYR